MISSQIEGLIDKIRNELSLLQNAIKEQITVIRDASETNKQKQGEVGVEVSSAIREAAASVPEYEKTQRDKEYSLQRRLLQVTFAGVFAASLAAVGAFIYARIAAKQSFTMQQTYGEIQKQTCAAQKASKAAESAAKTAASTLELNKKSLLQSTAEQKAIQRAYLSFLQFDSVVYPNAPQFGKEPIIVLNPEIENSGNTPAIGVAEYFNIEKLNDAPNEKTFIGKGTIATNPIGPRTRQRMGPKTEPPSYWNMNLDTGHVSIRPGDVNTFFWGWIAYWDVFDHKNLHVTEFCYEVANFAMNRSLAPPPNFAPQFVLSSCKSHNCQDEQCPDYGDVRMAAFRAAYEKPKRAPPVE